MKSRIEAVLGDIGHLRQFIPQYKAMASSIDYLMWFQSLPTTGIEKFSVVLGDRMLARFSPVGPVFELVADPREGSLLDREAAYSTQFKLSVQAHEKWAVQKYELLVASVAERHIEELSLAIEFALAFQKVLRVRSANGDPSAFHGVEFKAAGLLSMMREVSSQQYVVQVDTRYVQVTATQGSTILNSGYGDLAQAHLFSKDAAFGTKFLLEAEDEEGVQVVAARSAAIADCRRLIDAIGVFLDSDRHPKEKPKV